MQEYIKKLIYRSKHRGNKEMDILLGNFALSGIKSLNNNELKVYEELLDESDNDIWEWAAGIAAVPAKYVAVIKKICNG